MSTGPSEPALDGLDGSCYRCLVGHIKGNGDGPAALGFYQRNCFLQLIGGAGRHRNSGPGLSERLGEDLAETAHAAGDQRDSTGQFLCPSFSGKMMSVCIHLVVAHESVPFGPG
jgi:hypothetical protein